MDSRGCGHIKGSAAMWPEVGSGGCLERTEGTVSQGDSPNKQGTRENPGHALGIRPAVMARVYCQQHGGYNHLGDGPLAHLLGVVLTARRLEDPASVDKAIAWLEPWTV